jgi:hypothetical protein
VVFGDRTTVNGRSSTGLKTNQGIYPKGIVDRQHWKGSRHVWRKQISAEGEIVMRGSFAFVLFKSTCWYFVYNAWEEFDIDDVETSVMKVYRS